jgi:hypothetical protein
VETAADSEHPQVPLLLDSVIGRGLVPETCALDKGYDGSLIYEACPLRSPPREPSRWPRRSGRSQPAESGRFAIREVGLRAVGRAYGESWRVGQATR